MLYIHDGPGGKSDLLNVVTAGLTEDTQTVCSTFQCYLVLEIQNLVEKTDNHMVVWKMLNQTALKIQLANNHSVDMRIFSKYWMNATVMDIYDIRIPTDMRVSVFFQYISKRPPHTLGCTYANINILEINGTITLTTFSLCKLSDTMKQIAYVIMRNSIVAYQYGVYGTFFGRPAQSKIPVLAAQFYSYIT